MTRSDTDTFSQVAQMINMGQEQAAVDLLELLSEDDWHRQNIQRMANKALMARMPKLLGVLMDHAFDQGALSRTILWAAASEGLSYSFPVLFERVSDEFKQDVLARCAQFNNVDGMRVAIDLGAQVERQKEDLLVSAGGNGHKEVFDFVLQYVMPHELHGRRALDQLVQQSCVWAVERLIPYTNPKHYTDCLIRAAHTREGNQDLVNMLYDVSDVAELLRPYEKDPEEEAKSRKAMPLLWVRWDAEQQKMQMTQALDEQLDEKSSGRSLKL